MSRDENRTKVWIVLIVAAGTPQRAGYTDLAGCRGHAGCAYTSEECDQSDDTTAIMAVLTARA